MPYYVLILWLLSLTAKVNRKVLLDLLGELWNDIRCDLKDLERWVSVRH